MMGTGSLQDIDLELEKITEEEYKSNSELENFYRNIPEYVKRLPLRNISRNVIWDIVLYLNSRFGNSDYEWIEFAEVMGISDRKTIYEIKRKAQLKPELPLHVVITTLESQNGTFNNVIEALLKKKMLYLLLQIKPYVEGLLNKEQHCCHQIRLCEEKNIKGSSISNCRNNIDNASTPFHDYDPKQKTLHSEINQQNIISVMIINHEIDTLLAEQVSEILQTSHNMRVTILSDMEHLISVDLFGALDAKLKQVDFTVPIISESFLKTIHPRRVFNQQSNEESIIRYMFKWEQQFYQNNSCLNFRVRALVTPGFNTFNLSSNPLLSGARKLWKEFPKFVKVLQSSKNFQNKISLQS